MKKKILFIILSLVLAGLIFYGGIYVERSRLAPKTSENSTDFYRYFSPSVEVSFIDGFGIIKEIDTNNSTITLSSQISQEQTFKLNFNEDSRFYLVFGWDGGTLRGEEISLADLKIGDKVYFVYQSRVDGEAFLYWLNVAGEPPAE